MKHEEYILLTLLFLLGLFIWTLPIQDNPMPFGEGDSAWHFANSDAMAQYDTTFWRIPEYIGMWYYDFNKILGPNALEYPPTWHLNGALFQIISGQRVVPIFVYMAISCFIGAFSLYFFVRKLYGIEAATLAAAGVILSYKSIMVYLWGQRPSIAVFIFTPLILYSFYKFVTSFYENKTKVIYLYILSLLIVGQFLIHVMGSIQTFLIILLCTIIFAIKYKKLPLSKTLIKHYLINIILIIVLTAPFYVVYIGGSVGAIGGEISHVERLLYWFDIKHLDEYPNIGGAPLIFYDNQKNYFLGYFIFVIIGVIYLLFKREDKDLLMLGWLAGTYLSIHMDVFGLFPFHRVSRLLISETALFYALMGIGVFSFIKLIKSDSIRMILKGTAIAFFIMVLFINFGLAKDTLRDAYDGPIRLTENQYKTAEWIEKNVPHNSHIYYIGQLTYPKQRFMYVLSKSFGIYQQDPIEEYHHIDYVLIDYSDFAMVGNTNGIQFLNVWEQYMVREQKIRYYLKGEQKFYDLGGEPNLIYKENGVNLYKILK